MKIFKKAISLVLVFAMLASFAGMTGYKYSPMSIEAEAKHFVTPGGAEITMQSFLYKINFMYTMGYRDAVTNEKKTVSADATGDYILPQVDGYNDLAYKIICPAGTTKFGAYLSLDGETWRGWNVSYSAGSGYWPEGEGGRAIMDRNWETAMYDEYGIIYGSYLYGKGVQGFRDYGKIYWKVEYTCNGKDYVEDWDIDILDWDRRDAGNSQTWNGAATSSKPTDSHAGKNALTTVQVPATLYRNSSNEVVQSMNSRSNQSRRFDTYAQITVPSNAYDVTIHQVDADDNKIEGQLKFSTALGLLGAYQGTSSNATKSGNTYKWNIEGTISADATAAYYHIEYKVDVKDVLGNPETITYIQYAASYVKTLQNHNAVWAIKMRNDGNGVNEAKSLFNFLHEMGFLPTLAVNGVDVAITASGVTPNYNGNWTWNSYNSDNSFSYSGSYAVGFDQTPSFNINTSGAYWTGGVNGKTATSNSLGATIYYDSDSRAKTSAVGTDLTLNTVSSASIGMDMFLIHAKGGRDSGGSYYKWVKTDGYCETWTSSTSGWTYTTDGQDLGNGWNSKLTGVYSGASFTGHSQGIDPDDGLGGGTMNPTQTSYYNYTLKNLSSIPNLRCSVHTSCESKNAAWGENFYMYAAYGWHINMVAADRSSPHDYIENAMKNNYVKQEMDATWWNSYRKSVFAAYVNCGNLTAGETISFEANLSNPKYKFADYSALNTQMLTGAEWDRGGKAKVKASGELELGADGYAQADTNYLDWGVGYEKWNKTTYNTADGKVKANGSYALAAYDLVYENDVLKISSTPRDGSYYYTTATWNAYTKARNNAAKVYNYPNSTAGFDYNTAYPEKKATENGNQTNVGLACYHQADIDGAVTQIIKARDGLVKYDSLNGNYNIEQYYRLLISEVGAMVYDSTDLLDFDTKHGLVYKDKATGNLVAITSYDEETLQFRASHADDVFDWVYTEQEAADWNAAHPDEPISSGTVYTDEQGRPLYKKEDGTIVLASEVGDVGILSFPRADGSHRPVGKGNTFPQLYFDNSAASQYAVTSGRTALMNRTRWYYGGNAAGYEYLGMVEGVYNQNNLTELQLCNNPKQYMWTGKEHQDDILREIYALLRVRKTLRLATNYKDVYEALNVKFGNVPDYDAEGKVYNSKNLHEITIFKNYSPASAWDTVSYTITNENNVTRTYNTTGKTWYTEETWADFVAARNKLAGYIYNGSTGTVGNSSEIVAEYDYTSGLANKYYTYDAKLTSGEVITNKYFTNGYNTAGGSLAYAKQGEINQAVADYYAAIEALELKDLDAYTWKPFDEDISTVNSIKAQVQSMLTTATAKQPFYDFVPETNDGKITGADLDETKEIYVYNPSDVTLIEAYADAVLAASASAEHPDTPYQGDDNLGDKAAAFDSALKTFKTQYDNMVNGATNYDTSSWSDILNHLTTLAGMSGEGTDRISTGNLSSKFTSLYSDSGNIYSELEGAIDDFEVAGTNQQLINAAVKRLYDALDNSCTSVEVGKAADAAIAYPQSYTFNVYNYDISEPAKNKFPDTPSQFTPDSVATLTNTATTAKEHPYPMLSTYVADITADKEEVAALAATKDNGGVLEYTGVVTTYLNDAIDYAKSVIYDVVDGEYVLKSKVVTAPNGDTASVGLYSEQSVAELLKTIEEAQAVLAQNYSYDKQIEIDKYTFAVYEETTDATDYLLADAVSADYRTWTFADGVATPSAFVWTTKQWQDRLYGERGSTYRGSAEYGLKSGLAYYGFLDAEIKGNTILKFDEAGNVTSEDKSYIGTVWTANGELIYSEGSTTAYGERVFKNWSSYMDAYNAAVTLFNAQDKTVAEQSVIDEAAKLLYDKRNALELLSLYFPNNTEDFETAKGWYNELAAFVQKTDVTRYGWEYVDVTEEVTDETTGEVTTVTTTVFQKSADPLSSVTQSVYIYNGVDAAVEAEIESFRAKYASENSTEDYNSLEAAQTLYNNIKAALTDPATGELYTVKKTNDETLIAGMKDLTENYIAGAWDGTTYTSTLLSQTQVEALNGKQGVEGLLPAAQKLITPATDATANFGGTLAYATNAIFNYTKNPATNLQFAEAMKQQMVEFFGMTFTANVPDYYNNGNALELYVFDQNNANRLLNENVNPFYNNEENWPCIYELGKLEVVQDTSGSITRNDHYGVYDVTVWPSGATASSGTGVDLLIETIFAKIGAKSTYYADVIALTNSYHTDALAWIVENAIVDGVEITTDDDPVSVILADLNESVDGDNGSKTTVKDSVLTDINNAGKPIEQWADVEVEINYDLRADWYAEGYGCYTDEAGRVYYLYQGAKEIPGSSYNSWFMDRAPSDTGTTVTAKTLGVIGLDSVTKVGGKNYYGDDLFVRFSQTDYTQITDIAKNSPDKSSKKFSKYYAELIASDDGGWSAAYAKELNDAIQEDQDAIDESAALIYEKIQGLTLLPATQAYRDVYNTYLSVMGQHIADGNWNGDSYSKATQTDNVDFTFYNVSQASKIEGMYSELNNDAVPPYGIVSREQYDGFLGKYTQADEYADQTNNPWYNLVFTTLNDTYYNPDSFMNKFVGTKDLITIDQAEKVNLYDKSDNITSIKETLIDDYLSKLEFDDLVYDRLNAVVAAFLGDNLSKGLAEIKGTLQGMGFTVGGNYNGEFYSLNYYTDESLLEVAGILRSTNVLAENKIVEQEIGKNTYKWIGDTFPLPIVYDNSYKGTFYTTTTDQNKIDGSREEDNSVLKAFLNALNTQLVLRGVNIDGLVKEIARGEAVVPEKYDQTHPAWGEYIDALAEAKDLRDDAGNYDIRFQESVIDAMESSLAAAINALEEAILADNYAPSMTLKTSVADVEEFYGNEAYEVALRQADSASFTATGEGDNVTYTANPAAGTFFVPNSSGYSLIVYTNELNPRIVINLEDLEQNLAGAGSTAVWQDAAKQEYISINAKKTSGVTANVIAGTIVPANNGVAERMTVDKAAAATATEAVMATNNSEVKGSSAFAILAPTFVSGKATQAAVYTIEARDGSERNINGGTVYGNPVNQFDFGGVGQEPVDIEVLDSNNKIAIYVYYYSLKAADGKDEGINADGTALATPAIEGTHVPSALLSGEPGFKGQEWRNGVLLQRHFSDSHRVWEYVSEIKQNEQKQYSVNGTQVPVYNDPTFGYLNTGSFYYVLDEKVAADAEVIEVYDSGNDSVAGCMDYDRATAAKTAMINAINAMDETELNKMKESSRFYNYGDYETDEFGNVLYNGDEAKWINWAQSLNSKVENGDLVFVHVVDRWGNVVNRIIEVTNFDKKAPQVNSAASGAVSINEAGGAGIKDITVHNGDFSLGKFDYEINQSQKLTNGQVANNATVESADNTLTIKGLVPGKLYYIGAYDNAGNAGSTPVNASVEGKITLTITVEDDRVETGEEGSVASNSTTFTLNGTDTIILNSGEASSVIDASLEGNVFANRTIRHYITTKDNVTALKTVYQDGTVEEFTAETATVKDNGDGTLTWTIKRKLAEGEHKYKVYAKVNGGYENFYAPATINATTRTVKIECTNVGQGVTQLNFSGSLSFDIANYISKEVPYGTQVTISAKAYTTYEGCEFYYWINNTTDRIISTADVYEFKAVTNADYIAQFTNNSTCIDGKKFVVYVNNAKNVIERFELADGDNYTVPTGPVLPDYTFKGWSMTKAEVLASDKDTVIVEPIYELNASNTVTITEGNYTATGAGTYTAEANQRAVVTISTSAKDGDGKEFLYWIDADTDEIVSYDRTYSFFCVKNTVLTPVYGDASAVQAEPIVRITEVKYNALSGKVSFFAERSVPEEFMILQTGIVVTKTESIGTNEEVFVVGGTSTAAGTSTSTANNGYYSANTVVATGQTVWARAYVIYETADGEIFEAYGPVVSYTVD